MLISLLSTMFLNKEPSGSHTTDPHYLLNHTKNFDTIDDAITISKLKTSCELTHDFTESIVNNLPHWLMYEEHHYRKLLSDLPAAELKMTNSSCLQFIVDPLAYTERRNLNKRTYHSNILRHFENPHYNRLDQSDIEMTMIPSYYKCM